MKLYLLVLTLLTLHTYGQSKKTDDEVTKPVKSIIGNIRTSKDAKVFTYVDMDAQGQFLLGDYWNKASASQRTEFKSLLQSILLKSSVPSIREKLTNLVSIQYEPSKIKGNEATVESLITLDHPLKKQEIKVLYTLVKSGKTWKLKDYAVLGESLLTFIREQVKPVAEEGGMDALLTRMRKQKEELYH